MKHVILFCVVGTAALGAPPESFAKLPQVPVGITASSDGRLFVSFSRAIDPTVPLSVAELEGGVAKPFPPGFEQTPGRPSSTRLLSVQSVWVDADDKLWILDSGRVGNEPVAAGAPQLIAWDLARNSVVHHISFSAAAAGPTSFLNDLRVELDRGRQGTVFITDAAPEGPNAIVVVDVASGQVTRALENHASVKPDPKVLLKAEGRPLVQLRAPNTGKPFAVGADGIALSPDGWLYYTPLTSRKLYRVPASALVRGDAEAEVEDLGDKGFACDGLLMDTEGRLYAADFENGAIKRRSRKGKWETISLGGLLSWPDTMTTLPSGRLLVTATQIHRSDRFRPRDERQRPFHVVLVRLPVETRVGLRLER